MGFGIWPMSDWQLHVLYAAL